MLRNSLPGFMDFRNLNPLKNGFAPQNYRVIFHFYGLFEGPGRPF